MSPTPPSSVPVSVDYTSRDYYSLREDLISRVQARIVGPDGHPLWTASDPADFGVALVEAFAYMGDMLSYYIDRAANEAHISTAVTRKDVLNHAKTYGYIPAGWRQAFTPVTIANATSSAVTVPAGAVVTGQSVYNDTVVTAYFTTTAALTIPASSSASVNATHGISCIDYYGTPTASAYGVQLAQSSGKSGQTYTLPDPTVADGSISVYVQSGVNYLKWTQVTHLIDYGPSDLVYSVELDENDNTVIRFGDGVSGAVPPLNEIISAVYTIGGGAKGNVSAGTLTSFFSTTTYTPTAGVTVSNGGAAIGGEDPESTDEIRSLAPLSLRALNRAVTLRDYEDLANFVSGVGKAKATGTTWSSVTLYIAPSRSSSSTDVSPGVTYSTGLANSEFYALQKSVQDYLSNKTLLGVSVTVSPPTYADLKLHVEYIKRDQYSDTEVQAAISSVLAREFNYVRMPFNDTLYPQDIEFVLQQSTGVKLARVKELHRMDAATSNLPGTISSITSTGAVVTVTMSTAHNLSIGNSVIIAGVTTTTGYNGTWTVTSVGSTTFTFSSTVTGTAVVTSATAKTYTTVLANPTGSAGEILRFLSTNVSMLGVSS